LLREFQSLPEEERRRRIEGLSAVAGSREGGDRGDILELLGEAIGDPSWRVRKSAVEVFLSIPEALEIRQEVLDRALRSEENAGRRNSAIEIYIRLGKKALSHVRDLVRDQDPDVRKFAVEILIEIGGEEVESVLLSCLRDEDENTRMAAVEGLGRVGSERAVAPLLENLYQAIPGLEFLTLKTLGEIGARGALLPIEPLAARLGNPTLREMALRALGYSGNPAAVPILIESIREGRSRQREQALTALACLAENRKETDLTAAGLSPEEILPFLKHSKKNVRLAAVQVMSRVRCREVLSALLPLLLSGEEDLQTACRSAIIRMGLEALATIIPSYRDLPREGRHHLVEVLGVIDCGEDTTLESHRNALLREIITLPQFTPGEKAEAVLAAGKLGLVEMAGEIAELLDAAEEELPVSALSAMRLLAGSNKERVIGEVLSRLREGSERLRRNLLLLLGETQADGAVSDIVLALKAEEPSVREAAAIALAEIQAVEAEEDLILCLADEDSGVRVRAAQALGRLGREKSVEPLRHALQDEDIWVRAAVAESLGQMGTEDPRVVEALARAAEPGEGPVVVAAVGALARIGGEEGRRVLVKMLRAPDPEVVIAALESLSPLRGEEVSPELFISLISHSSFTVRLRVVQALKEIGKDKSSVVFNALRERLEFEEDPLVREALLALLRSGKGE